MVPIKEVISSQSSRYEEGFWEHESVVMLSGTSKPSFAPNEQTLKVALQRLLLKVCIPVLSRDCEMHEDTILLHQWHRMVGPFIHSAL